MEHEVETRLFQCSRLDGEAEVTETYGVLPSGGRTSKPIQFDCDSCRVCGVGQQSGSATNFNWSLCVHPAMKDRRA